MFNFRLRKRYSCPAGAGHADAWIFTHAKAAKAAKVGKGVGELDLGFRMFNFSPQLRPRRRPRLWSGQVGVKTRLRVDVVLEFESADQG